MIETYAANSTGGAAGNDASAVSAHVVAEWLRLAATPTFAVAALLTGVLGRTSTDILCSAAHGSVLTGMVPMYLLMSAFHSSPWLKLMHPRVATTERAMQETLVARRETHITAPPAAVFALLTDPDLILRWIGTEAQIEPQPGGLYLLNVTGAGFARGTFREVVPVHRLAYSFGWDGNELVPPGSSLIEIDLIERLDGTLLRLTHTGLPNAEQCAAHAEGWAHYLDRLAEVAAGRDPGPDPWHGRTRDA
jgi:uncharacterized protein YndB with AHSA1/START domain